MDFWKSKIQWNQSGRGFRGPRLGLLLGIGLTYGLNYLLVTMVSGAKMDWRLVISGVAGMWIIGQLAALLPAWRGARISPSVATRTV